MRPVLTKLTPTRGFSSYLHYALLVLLPLLVFILVRLDFTGLALVMIILAKWRMLAVRPRFWPANIRANAVDIMFGVSIVIFMHQVGEALPQLLWAVAYALWLIIIKPRRTIFWISIQAGLSQLIALSALYAAWNDGPTYALSLSTGLICYLAARHFIDSFDEAYARLLSYIWGYFGAAIGWLTSHVMLNYRFVEQPTLLLTTIGYSFAALYYLDHYKRLSVLVRRQLVFILLAVVTLLLVFSPWDLNVV